MKASEVFKLIDKQIKEREEELKYFTNKLITSIISFNYVNARKDYKKIGKLLEKYENE